MEKIVATAEESIAELTDGATIALSGFSLSHGVPTSLIVAIRDKGVKDLTIVCNSLGAGNAIKAQMLVKNFQVKKVICAFSSRPGMREPADEQIEAGSIEVELVPQGILVERLRAAGAGLAGFYSPTGIGTPIAEGKDVRLFDGKAYVLERALPVDYALPRAWRADRHGNVQFRGSNIHFNVSMAKAARQSIVEVDEIVDLGGIPSDRIGLPGIFVSQIVQSTVRVDQTEGATTRRRSVEEARRYNGKSGWTRSEMARRVVDLLPDDCYVNLGSGMPGLIPRAIGDRKITLHAENGILGYGDIAEGEDIDPDIFDASGHQVLARPGVSYFDSVTSFEMARGGHLDATVLGAYEVDEEGNLANYSTGDPRSGGIGGAMDLIAGKQTLIVMMEHRDSKDRAKLLKRCQLPLTGANCVDIIVTDLGIIRRAGEDYVLEEVATGFAPEEVVGLSEMTLRISPRLKTAQGKPVATS